MGGGGGKGDRGRGNRGGAVGGGKGDRGRGNRGGAVGGGARETGGGAIEEGQCDIAVLTSQPLPPQRPLPWQRS